MKTQEKSPQTVAVTQWYLDRGLSFRAASKKQKSNRRIKVLFVEADIFQEGLKKESESLFGKICAAMNFKIGDYEKISLKVFESGFFDNCVAHSVVLLGQEPFRYFAKDLTTESCEDQYGSWLKLDSLPVKNVLATFHPIDLIVNPSLKRAAWQHLQLVMGKVPKSLEEIE